MQAFKTPLIDSGDAQAKRQEIKTYFNATFDTYEELFRTLREDQAYYERPEPLRHPLIFYFGHTATFFVNKLTVTKLLTERIDEKMESMMAIGVDEMSWDDLDERNYDWPSVQSVREYRQKVRDAVNELIDTMPLELPIKWEDPFWIILMGIEHERIHLETSSVLIRQLPLHFVQDTGKWPVCPQQSHNSEDTPKNALREVNAGAVFQGREMPSSTYGWDNEYGRQETDVNAFKASQFLVSNGEFLEFIQDGGYQTEQWWTEEGWNWCTYKQAAHPVFWVKDGDNYRYRTMLTEIAMPWDWPVDVNYLEAKAYCQWLAARTGKPIRLPTEAEWYRLYDDCIEADHTDWIKAPGNINLEYWASSSPVNQFEHKGFYDVIGNVWQWTETAIDGFEGFSVHPAYDDFSIPTFDGKHNLIKGGSWISTGNEATRDSRYAFRRHFFQHAGFRYVESHQEVEQTFNNYETDEFISQYLHFHYGEEYFNVPNYPKACINTLINAIAEHDPDFQAARAFDIGCAVGRSSFELAKHVPHVDALDFSTRFIRNALALREHGQVRYLITDEGELSSLKQISLQDLELGDTVDRVEFSQGDACNLKDLYTNYDLVFAGNLLDRLYEPKKFLDQMADRINQGGYLVLTSPYTWLEEYTEKKHWLGGIKVNGENVTTLDGLEEALRGQFVRIAAPIDVPFVIRETARKFQHTIAQMTIWQRCDTPSVD